MKGETGKRRLRQRSDLMAEDSVLQHGDVLTAADAYWVFFQPAQEAFVYVLQQDVCGTIDVLFPDPQ
jgi:hypothetical protein